MRSPGREEPHRSTTDAEHGESIAIDELLDDLVVVTNRQPYRHEFVEEEDGGGDEFVEGDGDGVDTETRGRGVEIVVDRPTGGLTAGLDPVLTRLGGTWIAWGDGGADAAVTDEADTVLVPPDEEAYALRRVWLTDREVEGYYRGFSNQVLWPLCHGFLERVTPDEGDWQYYRAVNRRFASAAAAAATPTSTVWLHDYHLALAPRFCRGLVPSSVTIAQFWHIPWPRWSTFERCPHRQELLVGLLGNDVLTFHVPRYVDRFLTCVDQCLDEATVDAERRVVRYDDHVTAVDAAPMGVDVADIESRVERLDARVDRPDGRDGRSDDRVDGDGHVDGNDDVDGADDRIGGSDDNVAERTETEWGRFRDEHGLDDVETVALGLDRLDYSKGVVERLEAVDRLFTTHPEWRETLTFVQKATPSRTAIPAYQQYRTRVRDLVDEIDERHGTDSWSPVVYTEAYLSRDELYALFRHADVMVVTSLADGMNLVAQEYVAARIDGDGALVLSDRTGAADVLGDVAYTTDPTDVDDVAATLHRALVASESERRARMSALRTRVAAHDLESWIESVVAGVAASARVDVDEFPATP